MPGMKILSLSIYSDDRFNLGMTHDGALVCIMKGGDFKELFCPILPDVSERTLFTPLECQLPIRNLQPANAVSTV
jgi:hypothetical protein